MARERKDATPSAPADRAPNDDEIRLRAYELYLERGSEGDDLADWLRAEDEYRGRAHGSAADRPAEEPRAEA